MARSVAAFFLIAAGLGPAAPAVSQTGDPFCTELRRIVHTTGERTPFQSLQSAPPSLPGLDECRVYNDRHGRRVYCTADAAEPYAWQPLVDRTARCLTGAIRVPADSGLIAQLRTATAFIVIRQHTLPGDSRAIQLSFAIHPVPIH